MHKWYILFSLMHKWYLEDDDSEGQDESLLQAQLASNDDHVSTQVKYEFAYLKNATEKVMSSIL